MKKKLTDLSIADLLSMYKFHGDRFIKGEGHENLKICNKVYPEYVKRVKELTGVELTCNIKG